MTLRTLCDGAGRVKALLQVIVALGVGVAGLEGQPSNIWVSLWAGVGMWMSHSAYLALSAFTIVAESNGVNLTDGLDGLAASTSGIAFTAMAIVTAAESPPLAALAAAMAGAACGFLPHNRHKASCFMGDTGSLALGGLLGILAALSSGFAPLLIATGVFAVEAASVILQVCRCCCGCRDQY